MKNKKVFIYEQIYNKIKENIELNIFPKGSFLPPEAALCELFSASRTSVRKAVEQLVSEGILYVKQGRGTQVLDTKVSQHLNAISSFSATLREKGFKVSTGTISISKEFPSEEIAEILNIKSDEPIFKIQRIQLADGKPIGIIYNYLIASFFPNLDQVKTSFVSLYDFLEKNYSLKITNSIDNIGAKSSDFIESELLKLPLNSPLLVNKRITFTNNVPFEYVIMIVDANKYEFKVSLTNKS